MKGTQDEGQLVEGEAEPEQAWEGETEGVIRVKTEGRWAEEGTGMNRE